MVCSLYIGCELCVCGGLHTQIGRNELELVNGYHCSPGRAGEGFLRDAKKCSFVLYAAAGDRQLIGISAIGENKNKKVLRSTVGWFHLTFQPQNIFFYTVQH